MPNITSIDRIPRKPFDSLLSIHPAENTAGGRCNSFVERYRRGRGEETSDRINVTDQCSSSLFARALVCVFVFVREIDTQPFV